MDLITTLQSALKKIPKFNRVVIGVSGGVDSVVLAYVLKSLGYEIVIAHLNHQLRGVNSDDDERFVKNLAKKWEVFYEVKKCFIPKKGNLENNARKIRYDFLEDVRKKYKADYIATAHHLDDQVETILMHMVRGSGLRGQIGIKHFNNKLIRPMLDVKRSEVLFYAKNNNLNYRIDESNNDISYNRNFWRHLVIPYLKNHYSKKKAIDTTASNSFYEKIININKTSIVRLKNVSKKADEWIKKHLVTSSTELSCDLFTHQNTNNTSSLHYVNNSFKRADFNRMEDHIKVEILIKILGAKDLYGATLNRLMNFIKFGQSGKKLEAKEVIFFIEHDEILIRDKTFCTPKLPKSKITIKGIKWGSITIKSTYKKPLYVRQWQSGDKFVPNGMKGTKSVQNFFVDKKIPKSQRSQIPVIVNEKDDIMSVGDLRLAKGADDLKKHLLIEHENHSSKE